MQYLWLPTMVLAKFLHGYYVTVVHMAMCKMIAETVPKNKAALFSPMIQVYGSGGFALVLGFGLLLPQKDFRPGMPLVGKNLVAYKEDVQDEFWRFIYFFPIFMNVLMLAIFYTCIKVNPIMFSVAREHKEDALYLIDKVYSEG